MKRNQWQRMECILDCALCLESLAKQEQYILEVCKNDHQLQKELKSWLHAIHEANHAGFLDH